MSEDLEHSREHANEFLKEKDLLEVKMWELEDELELRIANSKKLHVTRTFCRRLFPAKQRKIL